MIRISAVFNNQQIVKDIYKNIKNLRSDYKLTQREIAERLGICLFSYSRIENGHVDIKLSKLEQIAAIYEMNVMQLLNWNNSSKITVPSDDLRTKLEMYEMDIAKLRRMVINLNEELYLRATK